MRTAEYCLVTLVGVLIALAAMSAIAHSINAAFARSEATLQTR
jgi:hypothetical protein